MPSGRGQFLLSLRHGLEQTQPGGHGGTSGACRKKKGARDGRSRRDDGTRLPHTPPLAVCYSAQSLSCRLTASSCRENHFNRLPPEIILKIFFYLDAASLFCVGFVNRQFHQLANDSVMWYELYSSEMSRKKWRSRLWDTSDSDVQDVSAAVWKKLLFNEMGCQKDAVWMKELKDVNPNTGMPVRTEHILRSLRVSWEITLTHKGGKQSVYEQSQTFLTDSSVIVCWYESMWPLIHHIYSIQLYGVSGSLTTISAKPQWRSLISKTVVSALGRWRYVGEDRLVKLMQFEEGITVGVRRGTWTIAFIMATLHFHRLVERSVLGSLFCPYRPEEMPLLTTVPQGLCVPGYTVLLLLHNSVKRLLHSCFSPVLCTRDELHREFVHLRPVHSSMPQKHTPISGKISFPWKAGELQGDIKNCCIMTVSVLDETRRPVWCFSSSTDLKLNRSSPVCDSYDGQQFVMWHIDSLGKLKMTLVWLQDLQLYFLISLRIWIRMEKVNTLSHKATQD